MTEQIEFHSVDDLSHVVDTKSVSPQQPGRLFADGETLYYEDRSARPRQIHSLPARWIISTDLGWINDMCIIEAGGKKLLVAVCWDQGVRAYDIKNGAEEWRVELEEQLQGMERKINPEGITYDNQGHLFITDGEYPGNECIQMFSAADGAYMGRLPVDVRYRPRMVLWSEKLSTLVVTHKESHMIFIKVQSID